jgi:hypothetical protein
MKCRSGAIVLLLAIFTLLLTPVSASDGVERKLILGAATPLHFFGNSFTNQVDLESLFGIIPPCTPSSPMNYTDLPCIRALQYRSKTSEKWLDAKFTQRSLTPFVELRATEQSVGSELNEVRGSDGRWRLNGGSASIWEAPLIAGGALETNRLFIVEATVASRVLPKTFSLSLVPVEIAAELTNDLSDVRRSLFRRTAFPEGYEFQIVIKQSQRMQPLQFVTSRTKNAKLVSTAGPKVALPEFIFSGEPSLHSVLETDPLKCSDPLLVKTLGSQCNAATGERWKVYPWDRSIIDFLNSSAIENFREKSTVSDWSFQGGQDTSLIFDLIQGCSYTNVFSLTATNAPAYHINPPRWDKTDSSLSVKIANTHLTADSQLQRGFFSIQLRLSSAACMWGIDRKSVTASVEIISESGEVQNVASSSIKIDEAADQVSINLSGFTFSSPTIKIRLAKKTSKKAITCVKGKQRIKLTSAQGRCPAGFKRI